MSDQGTFPGEELRARRLELGLTTQDVFRKIRIPLSYIAAIEEGDIDSLPAACYVQGFVRTYAEFLSLDANRFVDCFRACRRPTATGYAMPPKAARVASAPPIWLNNAITWVAVCVFFALAWFAYSLIVQPNAERAEASQQEEIVVPPAPFEVEF